MHNENTGRSFLLILIIVLFSVSCRTANPSSGTSTSGPVPPKDIVSLVCDSEPNCLSALCPNAAKCPLAFTLSNRAVFDFVKTYAECEDCNVAGFTPDKGIGKCIAYEITDDDQSWTVTFWVAGQCDFRYADPTQARISVKVSQETLTTERITPAPEFINDPLYCKNNNDCQCLGGSGVPIIGCSNFLYAPLNWSGSYAGDPCMCKAHQCIQT